MNTEKDCIGVHNMQGVWGKGKIGTFRLTLGTEGFRFGHNVEFDTMSIEGRLIGNVLKNTE